LIAGLGLAVLLVCLGCRSTPGTGRKQLLLVPESHEVSLGATAFEETLAESPPSTHAPWVEMVQRVGNRIAAVAGRPDYEWDFRVVASAQQNAFCLPGGKVVVYEGILPLCVNEAGLAVVMSHEIAHALARHGGERMSQGYVVNGVGTLISYVTQDRAEATRERLLQAYGVASKYGYILPYSRKHESEADRIGLVLMARAGYDPREAPRFWQRFAAAQQGASVPEFFSTHPADQRRAETLQALLAEAVPLYEAAPEKFGLGGQLAAPMPVSAAAPGAVPVSGGLPMPGLTPAVDSRVPASLPPVGASAAGDASTFPLRP
jgi:predicted Zn-dependent protease